MSTRRDAPHPSPVCGIIPPHLLAQIAAAGADPQAEAAARTLDIGRRVAGGREVRAARTSGSGASRSAAGLVPPHLRRRLEGTRPRVDAASPADSAASPAASTGTVGTGEAAAPTEAAAVDRSIHDAEGGTTLPGDLVREEGQDPTGDESADEAYDGLGATWSLYHQAFDRDSLDDAGMELVATVHYGQDFENAFWDGEQMIFGDGDGVYFRSFTNAVDVIGHELTHGVVQFTAGLIYVGQPGALHESVADCFGSMVKQQVQDQSAEEADWLIGEGVFTDAVHGEALRSMKAPGTAYDDPVLGKDPQTASMDEYADLPHDAENDNGGVHINSGIPNRAFHLAATGIGGTSWEGAGLLWYDALTRGGLPKDADFTAFARATLAAAIERHGEGSPQHGAVAEAWRTVGVLGTRR
ncbi:M4 family metallopeptidase [Brachybacterium fresconis]|uniref:Neutral metalloproteinase n=1 Tax=Brachybacterium fresconis TaxID=173363 RepID=A0ABS4YKR4_9MICO|nr:M4 family metallopeptidase [Brachybacterium fresconis]MBP2409371.1 Zn-dependent metalloprotease [Brachybacterium fresconis]